MRGPSQTIAWRGFLLWAVIALTFRGAVVFIGASAIERAEQAGIAEDGSAYYLPLATSLWEGDGFANKDGRPTASHMPGYPLLVAAARWVTASFHGAIMAIQLLSGSLTVGLVFLMATTLTTPWAAHLAALIAVCWPDLVLYAGLNLSENPFLCLALAGGVILSRLLRTGEPATAAMLGLVCGLGVLVRKSMVSFILAWTIAVLVFPATRPPTRRLVNAAVLLAALALTLLPWWGRNLRTFGEFIPLTTKGAHNIYSGTLIRPYYLSDARNDLVTPDPEEQMREEAVAERVHAAGSFGERDRILLRATLDNVLRDPVAQLKHLARKAYFLWQPNVGSRHASRVGFAPVLWLIAAGHWLLVVAGLAGLFHLRSDREAVMTFIVPFLVVTIFHVVVGIGEPRYHLVFLPLLIVSAVALHPGARVNSRTPSRSC